MKRLACEMCGSTELIKQDGVFVCQSCGCKYSVEEAKKMMIEGTVNVTGTVKVDNSSLIQNFLSIAKNAIETSNCSEAEDYCNKIIEIDVNNYEAWLIKGKAAGRQSTLANQRITETISSFSHALECCPPEKAQECISICKAEIEQLHKALLTARMRIYVDHPTEKDVQELKGDIANILSNTVAFFLKTEINTDNLVLSLAPIIIDSLANNYQTIVKEYSTENDGHPNDYAFSRFIDEIDRYIEGTKVALILLGNGEVDELAIYEMRAIAYDNMVVYNDTAKTSCSFDYTLDYYGDRSYYRNRTLSKEAIALRDAQNHQWQAEATKWRNIKVAKEKAIIETRRRKEEVERAEKKRKESAEKAQKELAMQRAATKRRQEYWEKHPNEKIALIDEKDKLEHHIQLFKSSANKQIEALNDALRFLPGSGRILELNDHIQKLSKEKDGLGVFRGKEKKSLQIQLDQAIKSRDEIQAQIESTRKEILAKIEKINATLINEISTYQTRIDVIEDELERER